MKLKIAIIEDDDAISSMYKIKLDYEGYEVQIAQNGKEGFVLLKQFAPDLTLLDLKMPIMSGDEMLEKLRATDWGSEIRVVILTNISKDEAPKNLWFLNVDRYIVKAHHTPTQVVSVVNEILDKRLSI